MAFANFHQNLKQYLILLSSTGEQRLNTTGLQLFEKEIL